MNFKLIKYLFFLDGDLPEISVLKKILSIKTTIIAADGAADKLLANNIKPDIIIGDMDSYKLPYRTNLIYDSDQNTTDGEKLFNYALKKGFNHCLVFGLFGQALDHTLYNLNLFIKYSKPLNLIAHQPVKNNKNQWILPFIKSIKIILPENSIISIIPTPTVKFSAPNLKWPVEKELITHEAFPVRNRTCTTETIIYHHSGMGLITFEDSSWPNYSLIEN